GRGGGGGQPGEQMSRGAGRTSATDETRKPNRGSAAPYRTSGMESTTGERGRAGSDGRVGAPAVCFRPFFVAGSARPARSVVAGSAGPAWSVVAGSARPACAGGGLVGGGGAAPRPPRPESHNAHGSSAQPAVAG